MASNIRYRPKDFNEVVGNKETIESLQAILSDPPHVFLFSGQAGCGKTTLARIVSDKLGCSEFDFKEINISDNRGIDTARDIIQSAHLKPMSGKVKVYLLDEVHKSTNDFQNALLKILEEPPSFVYFILCTTEPEKLIKTVRDRASMFSVSPLNSKKIKRIIDMICEKENIVISDEVIEKISQDSDGSPRKALVMFDQIKFLDEKSQMQAVMSIQKNEKTTIELCRALLNKSSWSVIADLIKNIDEEPEKIRRAVLGYASSVLLSKDNKQAALMIECFKDNYFDSGKAGLIYSCYQVIF